MNKRLIQIDHDTGEVVDGFVAYVVPNAKWFSTRMVSNGTKWRRNIISKDLGANDFKVLMKLLSVLDYENLIKSAKLILQGVGYASTTRAAQY